MLATLRTRFSALTRTHSSSRLFAFAVVVLALVARCTPLSPPDSVSTGNPPGSAFSASKSTVTVGDSVVESGGMTLVTLRIRDSAGADLALTGLTVRFSFAGGTSTGTLGEVRDNRDGTYAADFTGLVAGTPTAITATIHGFPVSARAAVSVVASPPALVSVTPKGIALQNTPQTLTAEVRNRFGQPITDKSVSWLSLNPNVVRVDTATGTVTPVGAGQAIIAASAGGATGYALATVATTTAGPIRAWTQMATPKLWDCGGTEPAGGCGPGVYGGWAWSGSDVWAHAQGSVMHYDGSTWSGSNLGGSDYVTSFWGSTGNDMWALGEWGRLWHRTAGSGWGRVLGDTPRTFVSVWGSAPNDIYLCDNAARVVHFDGASWNQVADVSAGYSTDIWGFSADEIFMAVGVRLADDHHVGEIYHYDGKEWSRMAMPDGPPPQKLWGVSSTDVFAAVGNGAVLHYDGQAWSKMSVPISASLSGIWGTSNADVYAVGSDSAGGVILRFDGANWTVVQRTAERLYGIWGTPRGDVFVGGAYETIIHGER